MTVTLDIAFCVRLFAIGCNIMKYFNRFSFVSLKSESVDTGKVVIMLVLHKSIV